MSRTASIPVIVVAMLLAANAPYTHAAEPGRVLNGHEFMPSEIVQAPFAISHFATRTGGGVAFNLLTPFVDLEGDTLGTLEGDVAFMALGFRYQQRIGDRFAARASFGGSGRIGIDEQSVLAQGVTGTYSFSFGGTARILQTEKVILSGALDFARTDLVGLDPYGFASRIIEDGLGAEDNNLVASNNAMSGRLGVLTGWAPLNWLGLTGYLEGGRGDFSSSDTEVLFGGGASAGVDFKNLGLIPIGVQLVVRTDAFTQGGADLASRTWTYGFGVFHTGWDDFSLGLETTMNRLKRRGEGEDFEAIIVTFNLRYWPSAARDPVPEP